MPRLSAYLIVKNEEYRLPNCLGALKGLADELVVVDDGSTDRTTSVALEYGAKVFGRALDGFGKQKQFALEHCTGDWVLSVDADESISVDLKREIAAAVAQNNGPDGYYIPRHMYFLGKRLRYGGVGKDWVLRLFRREKGRYRPLEIHEQVEVDGPTAKLKTPLMHFSYTTLDQYLKKIPVYTAMAAEARWKAGKRFHWWHHFRPAWELFSRVVLKGAWLDGQAGLMYAALSAHAVWLRSAKLWELQNQCKPSPVIGGPFTDREPRP